MGVLQTKFHTLLGQLKAEESEFITYKLKEKSIQKIESERNRSQNKFNAANLESLEKLETRVFDYTKDSESVTIIGELWTKLKTCQKPIF